MTKHTPTLQTQRLLLRPWQDDDAESLYRYAQDPRIGLAAGWAPHTSVENSREIIKNVLSVPETYAVCLKENNIAIGSIGLIPPIQSHTTIANDEMEIGYWIGVPYWGKGLIPEAVNELLRHAFNDLKLAAVWCGYYDGNEKSAAVQRKCGFKFHHTEHDVPCPMLNENRTEHFTRITCDEWNMLKNN